MGCRLGEWRSLYFKGATEIEGEKASVAGGAGEFAEGGINDGGRARLLGGAMLGSV